MKDLVLEQSVSTSSSESRDPRQLLHQLFEAQVDRSPEALACREGSEGITYRDLDMRANRLAHRIASLDVQAGARVAIYLERSVDMVVAILAVLKAGCAYVPLDPENPAERNAFLIEDSSSVILLSRRSLWNAELARAAARLVCLDEEAAALSLAPTDRLPRRTSSDSLAYVIYTSGSTGRPKGVMVTHDNVVRLFTTTEPLFGFGPSDVWTVYHSFAFDFSVWEVWGALLYGGRLVIVPYQISRTPALMAQRIVEEGVTVLCQTPSAFRQVAPALIATPGASTLRYVIFGGEALSIASLRPWMERFGDERPRCINMFGITETTVHVTYRPVTRADVATNAASFIGVPIPDLEIHLWNERDEPVAVGEIGEIVVAGPGVALGYLGRSELTRQRFLQRDGQRFYRSGDLARRWPSGDLEYLGRADSQVKLRGFRIEPEEIAARILAHGAVSDAVVRVIGAGEGARLVAYCVLSSGAQLDRSALRRDLQRTLPEYMLPTAFVVLDRLPLTVNGKLDVAALPAPGVEPVDFRAPETQTEQLLAGLWQISFHAPREIGRNDNFLACGGDSISAARVLAQLRKRRGVELSFREFFDAQSLAELARAVDEKDPTEVAPGIPRRAADSPSRLSFAEEQFSILSRLAPGVPLYAECIAISVASSLDVPRLRRAAERILLRHGVLRARYVDEEGIARRIIESAVQAAWSHYDLRGVPEDDRVPQLERAATARLRTGFDLAAGDLLRIDVYSLRDDEHRIYLSFPHILLDGSACAVLVAEIAALYADERAELAEVALDIDDVAAWQRARLDSVQRQHLPHWQDRLAGMEELELPADHARPSQRSFRGARIRRPLSGARLDGLRELAVRAGSTLFGTLLTAFIVLLHRHSGQRDIVLGAISRGRPQEQLEQVVGCLVNPVVLRQGVDPARPFVALLAAVRDTLLDAQAHDELPFATLVRALGGAGNPAKNPLFQAAFSANVSIPSPLPDWSVEISPLDSGTSRFDLAVQVDERPQGVELFFEYSLDLFLPETAERIADRFITLLDSALAAPTAAVQELAILSDSETRQILDWGRGEPSDGGELVHERIKRQAREKPQAVAALFADAELTYEALDRRSDELAAELRERGAQCEQIIGLCAAPSFEWLIGMLGILKAGCAFLPLDPRHPPTRLQAMLADARVELLCTSDDLADRIVDFAGQRVGLSGAGSRSQARATAPARVTRHSLAYIIYTSGSTGAPKGAMMEHGGLANMVEGTLRLTRICAADRVAQLASPAFDACIVESFPVLAAGGTLVIAMPHERLPGQEMADLLTRHRVTVIFCVPSTLSALPERKLPELRLIGLGGDVVGADLVKRWAAGRCVLNMYAPTEATVFASAARCDGAAGKPAVGTPMAGVNLYVVDTQLRLAPIGVPGEMLIGGLGVARGYLDRPALTAERFLPDPFAPDRGGRVYRSGDRVRLRADGQFEFISRVDRQVKLRGFRIELGEIEATLMRHPLVGQALVVVREEQPGARRLVGYVVPRPEGRSVVDLTAQLRAFLSEQIPDYMVPAAFVVLESLPLSANGKLDQRALPAPRWPAQRTSASLSDLERSIAKLWGEVLGLAEVDPESGFFEMGGDSLSLARVQALLRARIGVELDMVTLLRVPTVRSLAACISQPDRVQRAKSEAASDAAQTRAALARLHRRPPGAAR